MAEVLDFIEQTLEGLEFMHRHGVAHRDCTIPNIRMDSRPLFRGMENHPIDVLTSRDGRFPLNPLTRSEAPVKYYFIDFGISTRFEEGRSSRLVTGIHGRERDVPELSRNVPYDPFKVDIFILGNCYRRQFVQLFYSFRFLLPLVNAMTRQNPAERPTASEALAMFWNIKRRLYGLSLRWRLQSKEEPLPIFLVWNVLALFRELVYQLRGFWRLLRLLLGRPR